MTAPRNALAHALRPPRGAAAGVRAPRPAYPRTAAAALARIAPAPTVLSEKDCVSTATQVMSSNNNSSSTTTTADTSNIEMTAHRSGSVVCVTFAEPVPDREPEERGG
jgi:hypothetical protein